MAALVDSGFIISLLSEDDKNYRRCATVYKNERGLLLPSVTLAEIAHLMIRNGKRMVQYAGANIDLVDSIVMAMAERLNITRILTVDQRDFRMFRPNHTPHFTILP